MTRERGENQTLKPYFSIELGKKHILPSSYDLDYLPTKEDDVNYERVRTIPFEIKGLQGLGHLEFWQSIDTLADIPENESKKLLSDYVDVRLIPDRNSGAMKPDPRTLPADIMIVTPPLTKGEIDKIYVELEVGKQKYTASYLDFDEVELENEGRTEVSVIFWKNPEKEEVRFFIGSKSTISQKLKLTIGFKE